MKTKSGFSLIEVIVSAVILGLISFAFIQFLNNAAKGQKNVQNSIDFDILKTSLVLLINSAACSGAFRDASDNHIVLKFSNPTIGSDVITSPVPIAKIVMGSTSLLDMSAKQLGGGLELSKLEFTSAIYEGDQMVLGKKYKSFSALLSIAVKKQSGSFGINQLTAPPFGVHILADGTSQTVDKCNIGSSANVGFVTVSALSPNPTHGTVGGDNWMTWNDGQDHRPSKICQDNGYADTSGTCKVTVSAPGWLAGKEIEGSIQADFGRWNPGNWSVSCAYLTNWVVGPNLQFGCIK